MTIYVDNVYDQSGTGSDMTAETRQGFIDALALLYERPDTAALLGKINGNVIITTYFEGLSKPSPAVYFPWHGDAAWRTALVAHFQQTNVPVSLLA